MTPDSPLPPPPYPSDVRAKGWRLELDYEQIERSDSWDLAGHEPRPWLLMMQFVSWRQVPCGSYPADEAVIAAKIGMPERAWRKHRGVLMREWFEATDGRVYHRTLTERVLEMMKRRRSDSDRQAERRRREAQESPRPATESQGTPAGVPDVSRVTPTGLQPESGTDNRQPTTEESALALSARGAVGIALKAAGLDPMSFNLADPRVDALISAGATPENFEGLAREALAAGKNKPWAWVLTVLPERLKAGAGIKANGKHAGFATKDYSAGDGSDGLIPG